MPKQVDPHERRTLLADALLRVAATRGLMDVSLRHVAAEAGVTAGMVQHYFRTKDEMMVFALDVVSARVQARLEADPTTHDGPRALVRALLVQLLPVDDDRVLEGRVAIAFHAYAASRPDVATRLREDTRGMRAMIAEQIRARGHSALDPEQRRHRPALARRGAGGPRPRRPRHRRRTPSPPSTPTWGWPSAT